MHFGSLGEFFLILEMFHFSKVFIMEYTLIHRALTCNMHSLGTSQELCLDFLKKNVVAHNLSKGKSI